MSCESFRQFMQHLHSDERLKEELRDLGTRASDPVGAVIAFAQAQGFQISAEDIDGELRERDLDAVSGGTGYTAPPQVKGVAVAKSPTVVSQLLDAGAAAQGYTGGVLRSDRRLKSRLVRIGTHRLGIGIYEYEIFGRRERGVLADEVASVRPEAVRLHTFGIWLVDYSAL